MGFEGIGAAISTFFESSAGEAAAAGAASGAIGAGVSALTRPKAPVIPPTPVIPQAQVDQEAQAAEDTQRRQQAIAGGLNSTVGTAGGQAGEALNVQNTGKSQLLGQ
jgi:hypothetical protein